MRINLKLKLLIIVKLLDFTPSVIRIPCFCIINRVDRHGKLFELFKYFSFVWAFKVLLQENMDFKPIWTSSVADQRFHCLNNEFVSVARDAHENAPIQDRPVNPLDSRCVQPGGHSESVVPLRLSNFMFQHGRFEDHRPSQDRRDIDDPVPAVNS